MSDLLTSPPGDEEADSRRRAMWALLVLALVAIVFVTLMVFFVGTGGSHRNRGLGSADQSAAPSPTTRARSPKRSSPASTSAAPRSSTSAHPKPTRTANPCPSATPCAVAGDAGGTVAALNKYRAGHGRPAVAGAVSAQAQQCALSAGDGPTCVPHYAWEPAPTQDGAQVISKMAGHGDGEQWLLDPAMTSFSVGWAYVPGVSGGSGQYECAILKSP